ncbi:MAG: TetR family transcriptional regulator [Pseudomonadota bacterium]
MHAANQPDSRFVRANNEAAAPRRRTQEQRRAESEEAMLRAAERLFARQGYQRTTLTQVGTEAGYTGGLVSHRFGSKEGLLKVVLARLTAAQVALGMTVGLDATSHLARIEDVIDAHLEALQRGDAASLALHAIMGEAMASVPEARDAIRMLNHLVLNQLTSLISSGIEQGEFGQDIDATSTAKLVLGTLRGSALQYLATPDYTDLEGIGGALKHMLARGLLADCWQDGRRACRR